MFRNAVAITIGLILCAGAGVYFSLIPLREKDRDAYRKLAAESAAIHSKYKVKSQTIEPNRREVQKDIWIHRRDSLSHLRFKAANSRLSIQSTDQSIGLEEECEQCEGEVFDGEWSCHFRSDKARYKEKELQLDGGVSIIHSKGEINADHAVLNHDVFHLKNHVRLKDRSLANKESFAIADQAIYFTENEILVLISEGSNRVLFWQEGLSMSAPEVRIERKNGSVEGVGDVHFSFNLEEKNAIAELFAKYL